MKLHGTLSMMFLLAITVSNSAHAGCFAYNYPPPDTKQTGQNSVNNSGTEVQPSCVGKVTSTVDQPNSRKTSATTHNYAPNNTSTTTLKTPIPKPTRQQSHNYNVEQIKPYQPGDLPTTRTSNRLKHMTNQRSLKR